MSEPRSTAEWRALGCTVQLAVTAPTALSPASERLKEFLADLDLAASRFRPDSEINRLDQARGRRCAVTPLLADLIDVALAAAEDTGGDVDPTLGVSMMAAGYDRDYDSLPTAAPAVSFRRPRTAAWREIRLDVDACTVQLPVGVRLDLGATAKAFGADIAATQIADEFGCGVLVSLGGDIAVAGTAPDGGWPIRVQDVAGPLDVAPENGSQTIALRWGGIATSSVMARRWVRGDRLVHHILDPRSGIPVSTPWRTVSVVADSCAAANVASTSAMVAGERALEDLRRNHLAARLVAHDGSVVPVGSWPIDALRPAA